MTTARRKIFANILFLGSNQGLTWLLTSVYVLVIPRYLGPAGMGILALMMAISSVIGVLANIGMRMFILREVARDIEAAKILVGPAIILSTVLAIICWSITAIILNIVNESETTKLVMYIFAVANILGVIVTPLKAALQGMDKMHYALYESLIDKGLNTTIALILAALNFGIVLVAASNVITASIVVVLYFGWFFKHSSTTYNVKAENYKKLFKGSFSFLIIEISSNLYLYLDAIILAALTNETVVGYYSVPTRLFGTLMVVPMVVGQAVLPTLSRLAVDAAQENSTMYELSRKTLSFLMCSSLPVAVGTTVMAEPIINFFYQSEFAPSIPIMIFLGWTVVPTYLGIGLVQILIAQNRQTAWTKLMVMAIFVNFGFNLMLISYFQTNSGNGGVGAAMALFLTELIIGVFGVRIVGGKIINSQLILSMLKSLVAALVMGALIWPLRDTLLFIPILAGVVFYGIAIIALGLVPFDYVRMLPSLAKRLKQKFIRTR
ncbi:MAG: flippase [Chloroflexota bacterium]